MCCAQELQAISQALDLQFANALVVANKTGIYTKAGELQGTLRVDAEQVRTALHSAGIEIAKNRKDFANSFAKELLKRNGYYLPDAKRYRPNRAFYFEWNFKGRLTGQRLLRRLFVVQPGDPTVCNHIRFMRPLHHA
jgi:hypothetical protein